MTQVTTLENPGSIVAPAGYLSNRIPCTFREDDVGPKNLQTDFK